MNPNQILAIIYLLLAFGVPQPTVDTVHDILTKANTVPVQQIVMPTQANGVESTTTASAVPVVPEETCTSTPDVSITPWTKNGNSYSPRTDGYVIYAPYYSAQPKDSDNIYLKVDITPAICAVGWHPIVPTRSGNANTNADGYIIITPLNAASNSLTDPTLSTLDITVTNGVWSFSTSTRITSIPRNQ